MHADGRYSQPSRIQSIAPTNAALSHLHCVASRVRRTRLMHMWIEHRNTNCGLLTFIRDTPSPAVDFTHIVFVSREQRFTNKEARSVLFIGCKPFRNKDGCCSLDENALFWNPHT
jgi:hypothetical protein